MNRLSSGLCSRSAGEEVWRKSERISLKRSHGIKSKAVRDSFPQVEASEVRAREQNLRYVLVSKVNRKRMGVGPGRTRFGSSTLRRWDWRFSVVWFVRSLFDGVHDVGSCHGPRIGGERSKSKNKHAKDGVKTNQTTTKN